ncbi:MAG: leucine-rich repeat domain-containing protein [Holosporaceae bacterium]|jgi:hypothetical protein|nr:leucine-rich repeat domain-containing protein [Holosporaceae bacterium]
MKKMLAIVVTILPFIGGEALSMIPAPLITLTRNNWQNFLTPDEGGTVTVPKNVKAIDSYCFAGCKSLSSISFESGSQLTRIESYAFADSGLESITIPRSVNFLGSYCFTDCESLFSVSFESDSRLTSIERETFLRSGLESITIPRSVNFLDSYCFAACKNLSLINFESDSRLTRIESYAFSESGSESGLGSITIPKSVKTLGSRCFNGCRSLSSVSFDPDSQLTCIGSGAFAGSGLESITIPKSVVILDFYCFSGCGSLSSIDFESDSRLTRIEPYAFSRSGLESITIPKSVNFFGLECFSHCDKLSCVNLGFGFGLESPGDEEYRLTDTRMLPEQLDEFRKKLSINQNCMLRMLEAELTD